MTEEAMEDERDEELASIAAIFPELHFDDGDPHLVTLDLPVTPTSPLPIAFKPTRALRDLTDAINGLRLEPLPQKRSREALNANEPVETHTLIHLPPLHLQISLPNGYPDNKPPLFQLRAQMDWIQPSTLQRLITSGVGMWEDYGRSQVIFAYIDFLQQEAESAFGHLDDGTPLVLPARLKTPLLEFDRKAQREKFEQETFDCGICLEPKRGSSCHRLKQCSHVFCVQCLQDFYNNAITEGDVASVKCLAPDCGKQGVTNAGERRKRKQKTLHPSELLEIPLERSQVQRYVDMKLKKLLESDKNTVYCPRKWCQAPARSKKYAKYNTKDLASFPEDSDSDSDTEEPRQPQPAQQPNGDGSLHAQLQNPSTPDDDARLSICSKCAFAFCNTCHKSWHGSLVNCRPPPGDDLSAEEQASVDYIRFHTSPCPTCNAPCQKTHGCNHMRCFTCGTHFCYLCSSYLIPDDPFAHFNGRDGRDRRKNGCYMRLWELEGGDDGEGMPNGFFGGVRGAENYHGNWDAAGWAANGVEDRNGNAEMDNNNLQRFLQMAANDEEDGWDSGDEGDVDRNFGLFGD